MDAFVLGFALVVAMLASFLFGLAPALQVSGVRLSDGIRQGGKGSSIGARGAWARNVFVVAEVALAALLVVGAGLLSRSLVALTTIDMGFESEQLLVVRTQVPIKTFNEASSRHRVLSRPPAELRALPGVEAAGAVTSLPTLVRSNGGYQIEGRADLREQGRAVAAGALHRRDARLLPDVARAGDEGARFHRRRSPRGPVRRDRERVAGAGRVPGRGPDRPPDPVRARHAGVHDDRRRRRRHPDGGAVAAVPARDLHALRAASRAPPPP